MNKLLSPLINTELKIPKNDIIRLRTTLRVHLESKTKFIGQKVGKGKGIVISAGGFKYFTCAYVMISMLRKTGCKLPIEVWYCDQELSQQMKDSLEEMQVSCKNIRDYIQGNPHGFLMKPLSILYSSFMEVLFLDADNNCLKDPTYIFDDPIYLKYGCLFWPDYWDSNPDNKIWTILDIKPPKEFEQESGQILVNKKRCLQALKHVIFFNMHRSDYYNFLYGDKDTFRIAWLMEGLEYFQIRTQPGSCGKIGNEKFKGTTMTQHDTNGDILFLHRNLLKWDVTDSTDKSWLIIKSFKEAAIIRTCELWRDNSRNYIDLDGDVEIIPAVESVVQYENIALEELAKLREKTFYKKELLNFYIGNN